jgi:glycosyltransferase involved in cell wall biosynthesis
MESIEKSENNKDFKIQKQLPKKDSRYYKGSREEYPNISVIIPLLNEEESLKELSQMLETVLENLVQKKYEVIFIDDGSTDDSYNVIKEISKANSNFKAIRFRRNYGKSAALAVGFEKAKGKVVFTMDADLQDDPNEIPKMYEKIKEGFDLVSGWKKTRHDPFSKTFPSKFFNYVTSKVSGIKLHDFNCGLKAYKREVTKSLYVYGEMHRYLPALAHLDGFKVTEVPVLHHPRKHGYSKFGASRFIKGFLDLITVFFTTKYLKRPLHFFGSLGVIFAFIGFIIDSYLAYEWIFNNISLSNRPLVLLGVALIIVGVQFFSMGLIGELIIKNNRQKENYSIKEFLNI